MPRLASLQGGPPGRLAGALVLLGILLVLVWRFGFSQGAVATARIAGGPLAPRISGTVEMKGLPGGTLVRAKVEGLPSYQPGDPPIGPHGFHIHEKGTCEVGDPNDPFTAAGGHYDPVGDPHGDHAGDFPVLFSNEGKAEISLFTDEFQPADVVGRAVIIHQNPDDFRTQPAGASGPRLACGVIR